MTKDWMVYAETMNWLGSGVLDPVRDKALQAAIDIERKKAIKSEKESDADATVTS